MSQQNRARRHLPTLRENLRALVHLDERIVSVNIGRISHVRFMLVSFNNKQIEHARSILRLGESLDTMLIARSMLEGLAQLLWAMKEPRRRPLLWRSFTFVLDWRLLRRYRAEGRLVIPEVERHTRAGLRRYGHLFLTKAARKARAVGQPLPADPYVQRWYSEHEVEIFSDVGGLTLWEEVYGPFSEWHHWRPGAIGRLVSFDPNAMRFSMTSSSPAQVASALASAFLCLYQTMHLTNRWCRLGIGHQLRKLQLRQLSLQKD